MSRLTAPYNFVPLNHTVVLPDWADRVSMDVPFSDGLCGRLDLRIEAITPLMIGGRTEKPPADADQPSRKHRFTLFGNEAIPGTSIKGAIRAVLEIATLGKIGLRMDDQRFAVRDLHNAHLYTRHLTEMFRPLSRAGWLTLDADTDTWTLAPCDYSVVRQTTLEDLHAVSPGRLKGKPSLNLGRGKTRAGDKYGAWNPVPLEVHFNPDVWRTRDDWAKGRTLSRADAVGHGSTTGTIVFTGQPQDRDKPAAKRVEFLFHSPTGESLSVAPAVREDFEHIHRDPNTKAPNREWAFWRQRLLRGQPVPVFWLPKADAANRANSANRPDATARVGARVGAIGLAMMFRLAYDHTTRDLAAAACPDHLSERPDFAETLFGFVRETKAKPADQALRGRVEIEPARLERKATGPERERQEILLAPRPGYYPAYVAPRHLETLAKGPCQVKRGSYWSDGKSRPFAAYTTYMDEDAEVRGWKRYPVSRQIRRSPPPELKNGVPAALSKKIYTLFTPLGAGSHFRTTVHLHNLRRVELGALLWSLTFGTPPLGGPEPAPWHHALGMGKSLGYGCVRLTLDPASLDLESVDGRSWTGPDAAPVLAECLKAFQDYMERQRPGWKTSPQVRHLCAMADPDLGDRLLKSGALTAMTGPAPFQAAKKEGLILPPVLDDPAAWPAQTPPPAAGPINPGPKPATRAGAARTGPAPAAPAVRRGRVDGELVTLLHRDGDRWQVQFADRSIDFIPVDEVEPE